MLPLSNISKLKLLEIVGRLKLFQTFTLQQRELLIDRSRCYKCKKGQFIQTEGEFNADLFIILSGEVLISQKSKYLGSLGAGQFIGENSFIQRKPKSASAQAVDDVIVICLDQDALTGLPVGVQSKFKDAIIDGMSERIAYLNKRIAAMS
jgi:CRP-like cAMP-binding protein